MHKLQLTPQALNLVALKSAAHYSPEIWKTYRVFIEQGSFDEDFPCCFYIRANNHYRHALSGRRLSDTPFVSMGDPDVDTLTWAKRNAALSPREEFNGGSQWEGMRLGGWTANDVRDGNMSWEEAVNRYGYTDSSKKLAYYTLGFILHLLQDMGCTEHVHDDPHGGSGFNGFEMWVFNNYTKGDKLAPDTRSLTPKSLADFDTYFINLSKLGYSSGRFHGGRISVRPPHLEPGSDLARMFKIEYSVLESEWRLLNPNGTGICFGDFAWDKDDYEKNPNWTKSHDNGEWWPTSAEIPGAIFESANDDPGFYYLELSGDMPESIDRERSLYPGAFLPTPLSDVEDQCLTWRKEDTRGKHLYSLIGEVVFPPIIEHSAGLIEHYFDIVNHPPYVQRVEVTRGKVQEYRSFWENIEGIEPHTDTVATVKERTLKKETAAPLEYGSHRLTIIFSEPVREVRVRLGDRPVSGSLDVAETTWSGNLEIKEGAFASGEHVLSIAASDKNNHYKDTGGLLDSGPRTPARRFCRSEEYEWLQYEPGEDRNHRLRVAEAKKEEVEARTEVKAAPRPGVSTFQPLTFQGKFFYDSYPEYQSQPGQATITIGSDMKVRGSFQITIDLNALKPGTNTPYMKHKASVSGTFAGEAKLDPRTGLLSVEAKGLKMARYDESQEHLDPWFKDSNYHVSGQADVFLTGEYSLEKREGRFTIGLMAGSADAQNITISYSRSFGLRIKN
jgi:hypothetical protein